MNRGLFDSGKTQMRQIVAGDFLVCGVSEDERFRQPEKFLTAGNVIFCVAFAGRMSYFVFIGSDEEADWRIRREIR